MISISILGQLTQSSGKKEKKSAWSSRKKNTLSKLYLHAVACRVSNHIVKCYIRYLNMAFTAYIQGHTECQKEQH